MRTITLEEFRADPVKAWEMAEDGDIQVLGKDGEPRTILHAMRDRSDQHWEKAKSVYDELAEMLALVDISTHCDIHEVGCSVPICNNRYKVAEIPTDEFDEIKKKHAELWAHLEKFKQEKEKW